MRRFYLQQPPSDHQIRIEGPEAKHICQVLRLKTGTPVEFFDPSGTIYQATLTRVDKKLVTADISRTRQPEQDGQPPLCLAQCLLKGKKMDLVVQKATELGVHTFAPLVSKYCENHGERGNQEERWQRIMIEACKQSHRSRPMIILPTTPLAEMNFSSYHHRLAAWEKEEQVPFSAALVTPPASLCVLLGPEGGLHTEDLAILHRERFTTFSLGQRILRGETAAIATTAIIQFLTGALMGPTKP